MTSKKVFSVGLAAVVLLYLGYGLQRFSLGVDFTDEGAYLAWPLRMLFGEKPFAAEVITLLRPLSAYLYVVYKLDPGITLYEFRLGGWLLHLLSFGVFAAWLFRLSRAPGLSLLAASVPFFACHLFGLATPSYNMVSSDCLLLALCLRGLAAGAGARGRTGLQVASGLALFAATFAHPGLGLVAAVLLLHETLRGDLPRNVLRRQLSPSNRGALVFVAGWLAVLAWLAATGALALWYQRVTLFPTFAAALGKSDPLRIYLSLLVHPFAFSGLAVASSVVIVMLGAQLARAGQARAAGAAALLAQLPGVCLILHFSQDPGLLPIAFTQVTLLLLFLHLSGLTARLLPGTPEIRLLLAASLLGALVYASTTYYFNPARSWLSGMLALPFAFGTGVILLGAGPDGRRAAFWRLLATATLALAVACAARFHYREIYRDAAPDELTARFRTPKLRHVRSTAERVQAVDALLDHLQPKIARGEPLLVYDDCPLLYYLLDALPAYGLAWAVRYNQSPSALRQLDREFTAKPLPRYAIRTLVDTSHPVWSRAPRTDYQGYPLNETVLSRYELERTIFPFEIWRLKPAAPREKTSPVPPGG